jgi:hypothetical protein
MRKASKTALRPFTRIPLSLPLVICCLTQYGVQLRRRHPGVEYRAFRRFGREAYVPKYPHGVARVRVLKHPTGSVTVCILAGSTDTPSHLSLRQIFTSRAVVRIGRASLFLLN